MTTKSKLIYEGQDRTGRATKSVVNNVKAVERAAANAQRAFFALAGGAALTGLVRSVADAGIATIRFERSLKVATGTIAGAKREMAFVSDTADRLGIGLEATAGSYAKLAAAARGTALEGEQTRQIFLGISEASRVLGLSTDQTQGALTAIEQIISKGKVSAEELRGQLGERLPGAFQIAARSIGVTTAALDDMLKRGELVAEDLLPALAQELRGTFGPEVEAAASDAEASFNRFTNSIFKLKDAIATSGILGLLGSLAEGTSKVAIGLGAGFGNADSVPFQKELNDLEDQLSALEAALGAAQQRSGKRFRERQTNIEEALARTREQIEATKRLQEEALGVGAGGATPRLQPITVDAEKRDTGPLDSFRRQQRRLADSITKEFETAEQEVERRLAELNKLLSAGLITKETADRATKGIKERFFENLEEIEVKVKKLPEVTDESLKRMESIADQAARNMQDAFADFLFDPFQDGVKGMLRNFLDAIRRMVAEAAAANIFASVFGGSAGSSGSGGASGFIQNLIKFQDGGSFNVGGSGGTDSQVVAFRATPGESVTVTPKGRGIPRVGIEQTINFQGNRNDIPFFAEVLKQNNEALKAEIVEELKLGAFT